MDLYEKIKELAAQKNVSIRQVEEKLKFSNATIRRWKTQTPGVDKIQKVADYFGVTVDFLLGREEIKGEVLDDTEEKLVAAFRLESKDLDEDGKRRFNNSLQNLIKAARETIDDSKKRKG
ncbi:helix-turn-helix domain-containing protein [Lactococcus lactis]|uniref:helix-turn-helix domain-containing protein n=1 Tax=Lactococcus lactis TaxID=1358 RepID=UPI00345DD2E6